MLIFPLLHAVTMSWNQTLCPQTLMMAVLQEKLVPIAELTEHLAQESEKLKEELGAAGVAVGLAASLH